MGCVVSTPTIPERLSLSIHSKSCRLSASSPPLARAYQSAALRCLSPPSVRPDGRHPTTPNFLAHCPYLLCLSVCLSVCVCLSLSLCLSLFLSLSVTRKHINPLLPRERAEVRRRPTDAPAVPGVRGQLLADREARPGGHAPGRPRRRERQGERGRRRWRQGRHGRRRRRRRKQRSVQEAKPSDEVYVRGGGGGGSGGDGGGREEGDCRREVGPRCRCCLCGSPEGVQARRLPGLPGNEGTGVCVCVCVCVCF